MFRQCFSRSHLSAAATATATAVGVSSVQLNSFSTCDAAPDSAPTTKKSNVNTMDYIGVFLDAASRETIRKSKVSTNNASRGDHVTLRFNPSDKDHKEFQAIMGKEAIVRVQAIARDEHAETAIVTVASPEDDGAFQFTSDLLHLTVSVQGTEGYESVYSNVLLERLKAAKIVTETESDSSIRLDVQDFDGELAEFDSTLVPIYNPYPKSAATVEILEEPIVLKGVVCRANAYDADQHECNAVPECGFCLFMRAGPCGDEFKKWEACLDKCKRDGTDFIDHCGSETLSLRDCVDLHPEYYSVLNADDEEDQKQEPQPHVNDDDDQ